MKKRKNQIPLMIQGGPNEAVHRMVDFAAFYHRVKTNLFPIKRYPKGRDGQYLFTSGWDGFHPVREMLKACDELGYETTYHIMEVIKIRGYNLGGGMDHFEAADFKALREELVGSAVLSGFENLSWREVLSSDEIMKSRQRELKAAEARKAEAERQRATNYGVQAEAAQTIHQTAEQLITAAFEGAGFTVENVGGTLIVTTRG